MKEMKYKTIENEELLNKIFKFLVSSGLENISVRELSKGTGIAQGSLYYRFPDKSSIICEATACGLKRITDEIFKYVFASISDLPSFFENCLDKIGKYRRKLRFIYQMASSPVYGERIRKDGKYFKGMYDKYAERLAEILNCDLEKLKPIVYLFVSAICDYAIWEDKANAQTEIDFIYSILPDVINTI